MAYMAVAASEDRKLNDDVCRLCNEQGIYVNVVNERDKSDFYFPGIYVSDHFVIALTADGVDQSDSLKVREEISNVLRKAEKELM